MEKDEYGHNVNENGVEIKVDTDKYGKDHIDIYDSCPAENPDHDSIHINWDSNTGEGTIVDTTNGDKETTDIKCYLTTACMRHYMGNFDDNCYYLDILRWFRDNYVTIEDKEKYYEIAPVVVSSINEQENSDDVFEEIYYKVIQVCVRAIELGRYDIAYDLYKSSILDLEKKYVRVRSI